MSNKMNRQAFVEVVDDLAGMVENAMVPSLFRGNIVQILKESVDHYYPPTGPSWKDRPDGLGLWVRARYDAFNVFYAHDAECLEIMDRPLVGCRWYGPIPLPTVEGEEHNV